MRTFHIGTMVLICSCLLLVQAAAGTVSWKACHTKAEALCQAGEWDRAYQEAQKAAAKARREHGEYHLNTAKALNLLADICGARGRVSQGVLFRKQALRIQERTCGTNHPNVVKSLTAIADLYRSHARPQDAERFYRAALVRAENGGWSASDCTVPTLEGLAYLYMQRDKLSDAASLYAKALNARELRRKYNPAEDLGIARDLVCLAQINKNQHNYAEASKLYRRALEKYRIIGGPNSLMFANTLKSLGELYAEWEKPARAIACLKRALGSYEKSGLPEGPMVGATLINLAGIYQDQKRFAQAEALYKRATAIYERTTGIDRTLASRLLKNARIWPGGTKEGI